MELNAIELLSMNNPIRRWSMRRLEFPSYKALLKKHEIDLSGKRILDIACGSGYSNKLLLHAFRPSLLVGFDLMLNQVNSAREQTVDAFLFQGDATQLALKSQSMDAAFGFGFLHHIVDWKSAVSQIATIIRPGGLLILEEPSGSAAKFFRNTFRFAIPKEGEFNWTEFEAIFQDAGFKLLDSQKLFLECFRVYLFVKE